MPYGNGIPTGKNQIYRMLSLTCKTAIKAVIYLSGKSDEGKKTNIKEISNGICASEHSVGKILQLLARRRIINSHKGPNGGFFLDQKQQEQAIIHIVEAIEGPDAFNACGLGLHECSARRPCPIHQEYKVAREQMEKLFRERTIRGLCTSVDKGMSYLVG